MKFCKDCVHYIIADYDPQYSRCNKEEFEEVDIVTGKRTKAFCKILRTLSRKCDEEGKYWEPKNVPDPQPIRMIKESDDLSSVCPKCKSSLKRKWLFFKTNKCINPNCENWYGK